jgi:hypothetical protein
LGEEQRDNREQGEDGEGVAGHLSRISAIANGVAQDVTMTFRNAGILRLG